MPMFIGESAGARVIQIGLGVADVTASETTPVLMDITTHDIYPAGPGASVVFAGLVVTLRHTNGYHLGVTPIVNGVSLTEQTFTADPPVAGSDGVAVVRAAFRQRGIRIAARVRQTAADGDLELVDVAQQAYVIRQAP